MPFHANTDRTEDRSLIATLMTGFIHRDLGEWDRLGELFHPEAMVHIMWFNGAAADFVAASSHMGKTDLSSKHVIANPLIHFSGRRAVTETNAITVTENTALGAVCTSHIRFVDRVEERDESWRILERRSVYDMSFFDVPPTDLAPASLKCHPHEYAALAHLLTLSGFAIEGTYPTRGSEVERQTKEDNNSWLTETI